MLKWKRWILCRCLEEKQCANWKCYRLKTAFFITVGYGPVLRLGFKVQDLDTEVVSSCCPWLYCCWERRLSRF